MGSHPASGFSDFFSEGSVPRAKILLVDDLEFFLEVEKDYLKQTPATIYTARNGEEALQIAARERPDLIFMDLNMPVMDGITCCRHLKADPVLKTIPVIMVIACSEEGDALKCRDAGCQEVLIKPVPRRDFLAFGNRYLFNIDRREKRLSLGTRVRCQTGRGDFEALSVDLSQSGIYLKSRQAVTPGESVTISFDLPGGSPSVKGVQGRVAWLNQEFPRRNPSMPAGFGVEFLLINPESANALRLFLESGAWRLQTAVEEPSHDKEDSSAPCARSGG